MYRQCSKQILLHFGAVDWKADVWVNDVKSRTTYRGFTHSPTLILLRIDKGNKPVGCERDPSDRRTAEENKQKRPEGLVYTSSGIQIRRLEPVAVQHIAQLKQPGYRQEDRQWK